jgi:hypothetical protein
MKREDHMDKLHIVKYIIILSLLILSITSIVQAGTIIITTEIEPSFDTTLDTTAVAFYNSTQELLTYSTYEGFHHTYAVAALEWNISSIPTKATILITNLSLCCTYRTSGQGSWGLSAMNCSPSQQNYTDLYYNITNAGPYIWYRAPDWWLFVVAEYNLSFPTYLTTDMTPYIQENVTNKTGRFSAGMWSNNFDGYSSNYNFPSIENTDPAVHPMRLIITYEWNGPVLSNESPSNGEFDVEFFPYTCIDFTHPSGTPSNITFYWYNTSSSAWEFYGNNATAGVNGTYCMQFLNATSPLTNYMWMVNATDDNGNTTFGYYSFTTCAVMPPWDTLCQRHNDTTINISWTKSPNGSGTTYTLIYYALGSPPSWGSGTLAVNTTGETYSLTGLDEAECFGISFWSNYWNGTNWTLSARETLTPCCTEGGTYRFALRYENTSFSDDGDNVVEDTDYYNNYINLSHYNCSTHRLEIHYADYLTEYYYLNASWYESTGGGNWSPVIEVNCTHNPLYFVMWWNWSISTEGTCECNFTNSYTRTLLPISGTETANYTLIDFYFITDRHVYNDIYVEDPEGNCSASVEYFTTNNLVKYTYNFEDRSTYFIGETVELKVYSTFYCYNSTKQIVVHQEYWDSSQKVYPVLLHRKDYLVGINSSKWVGRLYENIGLAPNRLETPIDVETIVISYRSNESYIFSEIFNVTSTWSATATGLYVYYSDSSFGTTSVQVSIYYFSNGTLAYTNTLFSDDATFFYPTASHNETFTIQITIVHEKYHTIGPLTFMHFPSTTAITSGAAINSVLQNIFGNMPANLDTGEKIQWYGLVIFVIGLIPLSLFGASNPGIASMGTGLSVLGVGYMINITAVFGVGFLLIFLGILMLWAGRNR